MKGYLFLVPELSVPELSVEPHSRGKKFPIMLNPFPKLKIIEPFTRLIHRTSFFYPQPLLVLLQRLFEFAHRRISGPQVESTPSWEELMWLWPSAFERLCSVPARLSPWSQLGRLLLL